MKIKQSALPKLPSERSFGLLLAAVFFGGGGFALYKNLPSVLVTTFFLVGALFIFASFFSPNLLAPLNRAWFALGVLLGKIVNPLVLGVVFFVVITPVAIFIKLAGRDALRLRKQNINSYWVDRSPAGPDSQSFHNQF